MSEAAAYLWLFFALFRTLIVKKGFLKKKVLLYNKTFFLELMFIYIKYYNHNLDKQKLGVTAGFEPTLSKLTSFSAIVFAAGK